MLGDVGHLQFHKLNIDLDQLNPAEGEVIQPTHSQSLLSLLQGPKLCSFQFALPMGIFPQSYNLMTILDYEVLAIMTRNNMLRPFFRGLSLAGSLLIAQVGLRDGSLRSKLIQDANRRWEVEVGQIGYLESRAVSTFPSPPLRRSNKGKLT